MKPSLFIFENSRDAALHNAIVLENFNYNLHDAILAQPNSQVSYGSEFRDPSILEELLQHHPHWEKLKNILLHGATFPLRSISPMDRSQDLLYHQDRGNHKSATTHSDILHNIISEDIERGYALPLPTAILQLIPDASLAPLGCINQDTINEAGERINKFRMTHDQTFPGPSGLSVNLRVEQELLPPCMYSFVLLRSLHYIISLRRRHPSTKIFISKFDIDAAYRRCHLSGTTAHECLSIHNNTLIMALRMTFGGSPCPSLWGYISDTSADLCNALIHNDH